MNETEALVGETHSYDLVVIHPWPRGVYGHLENEFMAVEPPMWARLIAGYIRDQRHSVAIIDQEAEQLSTVQLAARVFSFRPRIVAIVAFGHQPSASTHQMVGVREVARAVKQITTAKVIVVGGHVSALPERTLLEEAVDYACVGEGPTTILGLLEGKVIGEIPGLVWRDSENRVVINSRAMLLEPYFLHGDVWDKLPMSKYRAHNWQCFTDLSRRQPYASIYTTLGCPFKCLAGTTLVNTIYGPIEIQKLAKEFKTVPVFTYDPKTGIGKVSTARNIRQYGEDRLVRVHFDDGTHIDCTPDHKFLQFKWGNGRRGSETKEWACEAQDLRAGNHIRALRIETNAYGYSVASWKRKGRAFVHRMVAEWSLGRPLSKEDRVHHLDHDKGNWLPYNLKVCASAKEHFLHHPEISQRMRDNNPAKNMTPEWRTKLTEAVTGLKRSEEAREHYRQAASKRNSDVKYIEKLRIAAKNRPQGSQHYYTMQDGEIYRAASPRYSTDVRGRLGFNAHKTVNHVVSRVEKLNGLHPVYCLTVPDTGWFYANNVLVKNCHFCCINAPFASSSYRCRPADEVVREVRTLYETYNVKTFKIVDEMFVLNPKHYTGIAKGLTKLPYADDLNFWAYARIDTVKEGQLELLRQAGIRWLALGIESASQYVRDGADKRYSNDDITEIVNAVRQSGINVIANYIFGLPDDDMDSMRSTLDMALNLNTEFANFYVAQAYPGSPLYQQALTEGWKLPDTWAGYSQHGYETYPLRTRHVDAASVLKFRDEAFDIYFNNGKYLDMILDKFGIDVVDHVQRMTKHKIKRRLLEETYAPEKRVSSH